MVEGTWRPRWSCRRKWLHRLSCRRERACRRGTWRPPLAFSTFPLITTTTTWEAKILMLALACTHDELGLLLGDYGCLGHPCLHGATLGASFLGVGAIFADVKSLCNVVWMVGSGTMVPTASSIAV
jgi:hypothetical protein